MFARALRTDVHEELVSLPGVVDCLVVEDAGVTVAAVGVVPGVGVDVDVTVEAAWRGGDGQGAAQYDCN